MGENFKKGEKSVGSCTLHAGKSSKCTMITPENSAFRRSARLIPFKGWVEEWNDKQLELNACMLAPTPVLACRHQPLSGRCPVWWKQIRSGPPRWLS